VLGGEPVGVGASGVGRGAGGRGHASDLCCS
jgi:hypothetical protein